MDSFAVRHDALKLTEKQVLMAGLLAQGYRYLDIAAAMGIKYSTAKSYVRELYNKLGVFNAEEALSRLYDMNVLSGCPASGWADAGGWHEPPGESVKGEVDSLLQLSMALRKKRLSKEADDALADAVAIAQEHGFVEPFLRKSAELSAELGRLYHRLLQPGFAGRLDSAFVKSLYFATTRLSLQDDAAPVPKTPRPRLSQRQLELLRLLAKGYRYSDIAEQTGIKTSTIKSYLRVAYQKLGAVNRRDAVAKAAAISIL